MVNPGERGYSASEVDKDSFVERMRAFYGPKITDRVIALAAADGRPTPGVQDLYKHLSRLEIRQNMSMAAFQNERFTAYLDERDIIFVEEEAVLK
ncbi:MAG: hypothetical protein WCK90_01950 [archaeon]